MIEYRFEPELHRTLAYYDGRLIGECDFVAQQDAWLIPHTQVDPAFGGRGIARELVLMVAEEAQREGYQVVPICSYAVKVLG